jgi:hypothetical protein
MSKFQRAAHLNNEGVHDLLHGNFSSAVPRFANSAKLMREELVRISKRYAVSDLQCQDSVGMRLLQEKYRTVEIQNIRSSDSSSTSSTILFFNRAILVPTENDDERSLFDPSEAEFRVHLFTTAVIFNLALTQHLIASSSPPGGGDSGGDGGGISIMAKAERLYEMVLALLGDDSALLNLDIALVIKLACIDNMAQIRYTNSDGDSITHADLLLRHVSSFFSSRTTIIEHQQTMILSSSHRREEIVEDSTTMLRGLLINTLMLFIDAGGGLTRTAAYYSSTMVDLLMRQERAMPCARSFSNSHFHACTHSKPPRTLLRR